MFLDALALDSSACLVDNEAVHFGDPHGEAAAALSANVLIPLTQLAVLRASGADVDDFLQGQLSNDLRKLDDAHALPCAYSSPKGRMLAVFHLSRDPDGALWMEVHRGVAQSALKRLKLFVLRSKVELNDISETTSTLGLAGPDSTTILRDLDLPAPESANAAATNDNVQVIRRCGPIPRFTLRATSAQLAELWPRLSARTRTVGTAAWRLLDIEAGMATVYPQTQEHFVAQMANLDRRGGISFDKGCYTGQEIIARLHHLGTLKRRLFLAQTDDGNFGPGTLLYRQDNDQSSGEVVDTAAASKVGLQRLACVLQISHATETLHLGAPDGPLLQQVTAAD